MSPSRCNSDQPAENKRPHTRSESKRAKEGEFNSLEVTDPVQKEVEGELRETPRLDTDSSSDEE